MKKKSKQIFEFIQNLHNFIISNPQFRKNITGKSELQIQAEIRPLLIQFLEKYFKKLGYKDYISKANKSFYWEGQEGVYGKERKTTFAARNYPDFIITQPYLIAVEYKQALTGSIVKQGIGQSIMHTLCEEFHYVYYLFHDGNKDKKIINSIKNEREKFIIDKIWTDFNVFLRLI